MNLKWTKFSVNHHSNPDRLDKQYCKLFLGLELTSYIQAADDSNCTDSPAQHSALSDIVSLVTFQHTHPKNRSAMRTWVLCLHLFLSDGMLFANISIWELNYYQWKVRQVITTFKWKMSGRILFTYFTFISDNNLSLLCKKAYMGNPTLQILHSEGKFWN